MAEKTDGLASADVRRHNLGLILQNLAESGAVSRSELAERTGLKRGSITPLVQILQTAGLVRETTVIAGSRGRPRTNLELTGDGYGLIVLQISSENVTGVLATLSGTECARRTQAHDAPYGDPDAVLDVAAEVLRVLIDEAQTVGRTVLDVTVVTLAPVGGEPARVLADAELGWSSVDVVSAIRARVAEIAVGRVHLSSDSPLAALAELRRVGGGGNAIFIKGDSTIGGALVIGGRVVHGAHGFGSSLGHLALVPDGELCACGQHGCLITVAGVDALRAGLRAGGFVGADARHPAMTLEEIVAAVAAGDVHATAAWREAAEWIGRALRMLTMAVDPDVIVVGGQWAPLTASICEAFLRNRPNLVREGRYEARIVPGVLGADAALIGAVESARSRMLDGPEIFFS